MKNYEVRAIPKIDCEGNRYWTAYFPAVEGVVGGGATIEEAIEEAEENLEVFLEYLQDEKRSLPEEFEETAYSGKIALRLPRSMHKQLVDLAESENISLNSLINLALENYIGKSQFNYEINRKIEALQDVAEKSLQLQVANSVFHAAIKETFWHKTFPLYLGDQYE